MSDVLKGCSKVKSFFPRPTQKYQGSSMMPYKRVGGKSITPFLKIWRLLVKGFRKWAPFPAGIVEVEDISLRQWEGFPNTYCYQRLRLRESYDMANKNNPEV